MKKPLTMFTPIAIILSIGINACGSTPTGQAPPLTQATPAPTIPATVADPQPQATSIPTERPTQPAPANTPVSEAAPTTTDNTLTETPPVAEAIFPTTTTECSNPESSTTSEQETVRVYFSCDRELQAVERPITDTADIPLRIQTAFQEYIKGPTTTEQANGLYSGFTDHSPGMIDTVTLSDTDHLVVNFTDELRQVPNISTSNGFRETMELFDAMTFQFPEIQTVEYQIEGSCESFWEHMQSFCQIVERS